MDSGEEEEGAGFIDWLVAQPGHEWLCKVDETFIGEEGRARWGRGCSRVQGAARTALCKLVHGVHLQALAGVCRGVQAVRSVNFPPIFRRTGHWRWCEQGHRVRDAAGQIFRIGTAQRSGHKSEK